MDSVFFYLFALGVFFEVVLLCNWSALYPTLWAAINAEHGPTGARTFDVAPDEYRRVVNRDLRRLSRLDLPLVVFVLFHLFVWRFLFVPGTFDTLRLVNLAVVSLLGTFVVYRFVAHVLVLRDVVVLPLVDVDTAAGRFEAVIDFGLRVVVEWFLALAVLSAYVFGLAELPGQALTAVRAPDGDVTTLVAARVSVDSVGELSVLVGLLAVGVVAFVTTLWLVHTALVAAQRRTLRSFHRRYDEFYELWETEEVPAERLSTGLAILERRQATTEAARTWPHNASMLLRLAVAAQLPAVSFLVSVLTGV